MNLLIRALPRIAISEAIQYARGLLHPTQMRLPDRLAASVQSAIDAWDNGDIDLSRQHLHLVIEAAQEKHLL